MSVNNIWFLPEVIVNAVLLLVCLVLCICAVRWSFKNNKSIFLITIGVAYGSTFIGKVYMILQMMLGTLPRGDFNIGFLGYIGAMLFLLSSLSGSISKKIKESEGNKGNKKYSILSFCISFIVFAFCIFVEIFDHKINSEYIPICFVMTTISTVILFYSIKDAVISKTIRKYSISLIIYSMAFNTCIIARALNLDNIDNAIYVISILIIDVDSVLLYLFSKEVAKTWKI